jgi:hypothetical protein
MSATIVRTRVIICLLFLVSLNPLLTPEAGAQPSGQYPVLRATLATRPSVGLIAVRGDGFTPGGLVSIVLYDRWGQHVYAPVRAVASLGQYGPNGSVDPANGYVAPGTIDSLVDFLPGETFGPNGSADPANGYTHGNADSLTTGLACGSQLMVRANDARTDTWTDLVDIEVGC